MIKNSVGSDEIDAVELTEEEIRHAKWQKYLILEKQRKDEYRRNFKEQIEANWTAEELLAVVEQRLVDKFGFSSAENDGKPIFNLDDNNRNIILAMSYYFTNDPRFEKMGDHWSLNKGLALMGNVGRGKSLLMQLFANNKRRCYSVVSCRTASSEYAKGGHEDIEKYYDTPIGGGDYRTYYQQYTGTCFDDLGTEPTKKNYGNELNVMAEIILNRYDRKPMFGFECTHITTNLTPDEITEMYGTRVRSRFKEMFNALILNGQDYRQ